MFLVDLLAILIKAQDYVGNELEDVLPQHQGQVQVELAAVDCALVAWEVALTVTVEAIGEVMAVASVITGAWWALIEV